MLLRLLPPLVGDLFLLLFQFVGLITKAGSLLKVLIGNRLFLRLIEPLNLFFQVFQVRRADASSRAAAASLADLLRRRDELDREIRGLPDQWGRADELATELASLRKTVDEADRKRAALRTELRGLNFMERVYAPWRKQRDLLAERDRLGATNFPVDAPDRLASVEREIQRVDEDRRRLRSEDDRLKRESESLAERPELMQASCRVETLLAEESRVRDIREKLDELDRVEEQSERDRQEQLRRVEAATVTASFSAPTATADGMRLFADADAYRLAGRNTKRRVGKFRAAEKKQKRLVSAFREQLRTAGAESLPDAVKAAEKRLQKLEMIRLLVHREKLLESQLGAVRKTAYHGDQSTLTGALFENMECCDDGMPTLFLPVIWFFTLAGLLVMAAGTWATIADESIRRHAWWIGLAYVMVGVSMLGFTYIVRKLAGAELGDSGAEQANVESRRAIEEELKKTRGELDRVDPAPEGGQVMYRGRSVNTKGRMRDDIEHQIERGRDALIELRTLSKEEARLKRNKETLSRMRTALRGEQRKVADARKNWTRTLRAAGLDETLRVDDALAAFERSQSNLFEEAARSATAEVPAVEVKTVDVGPARTVLKNELRRFEDRVGELAVKLADTAPADPCPWLRRLDQQIQEAERQRERRLTLRRERKQLRSRMAALGTEHQRFETQRAELYASVGVTTKDEFEARRAAVGRASTLAAQIDEARTELERIASTEKELAIVEDDLMAFDADQNQRAIRETDDELAGIDLEVEAARERLGRVEAELDEAAADRGAARLRFQREQVDAELKELAAEYLAAGVALRTLDDVRGQVERNCQPDTLRRASEFLQRLTLGRYVRVWTRLGQQEILVSDEAGDDWTIDRLSTGTREQLFLALRLSLAEEFAQQGGELPVVLDDVLVNFDQARTEAAIQTLADVADRGQQVLMFSCHLHVAELLEKLGREAVYLPGREPAVAETRMAG